MQLQFVDNLHQPTLASITTLLRDTEQAKFAVAFVKYSGIQLIEPSLDECLENGGHIEFLVGLDFKTTDAKSLRVLSNKSETCKLFCYSAPTDKASTYHPKLYLFSKSGLADCIVGSSNLTKGGLETNVELNVHIQLDHADIRYEQLKDFYSQMKYQKNRFEPNPEYITAYEEVVERTKKAEKSQKQDAKLKQIIDELRKQEETLHSPYVSADELTGWQKLVYEKLPEGQFQTSDLYQYVDEFSAQYPENTYIEEKIRQVLQQLRELGLLLHMGRGAWKTR